MVDSGIRILFFRGGFWDNFNIIYCRIGGKSPFFCQNPLTKDGKYGTVYLMDDGNIFVMYTDRPVTPSAALANLLCTHADAVVKYPLISSGVDEYVLWVLTTTVISDLGDVDYDAPGTYCKGCECCQEL